MTLHKKSTITLHTGRQMPLIGLGTWKLTEDTDEVVAAALEIGYSLVDTSGDYGTQPGVGEGIERSGVARDGVYVVTKVEETEDSYDASRRNLDELGLEYADLMLIHRPPKLGVGKELWRGLIRAKEEGLVKDIGVSNYSVDLINELIEATNEVPVVNQIEWSPFGHSEAMLDYAKKRNMVIQAYSPLTRTEKLKDKDLDMIASKYAKTPAQIMLRWNLEIGTVPLPKANSRKHLEENIDLFDFELEEEDIKKLSSLNEHYSALGVLPYV